MNLANTHSIRLLAYCMAMLFMVLVSQWMLQQSLRDYQWLASEVKYQAYDAPAYAFPEFDDSHWLTVDLSQLPETDQVFWIRTPLMPVVNQLNKPPYALFLSGLFSADVYLNGKLIFQKGHIDADDKAGPIDSAIYIPDDVLLSDSPLLSMRVSTQKSGYTANSPFHVIGLAEFNADARRELRYYALPLILSSAFLMLAFQFFKMARSGGTPDLNFLALASVFTLLQLLSEVSRSFVSYPYDWHLYRSFLIWGFNCLSMACLLFWFIRRQKISKKWAYISLLGLSIASYLVTGFDIKTSMVIKGISVVLVVAPMIKRPPRIDLMVVAAVLLALSWLTIDIFSTAWLLDVGFYACFMVFLTFGWWWITSGKQSSDSQPEPSNGETHLTIKDIGKITKIAVKDVLYIKAEGNFSEVMTQDGHTHLHHLRLGQIMENPPEGFLRIHRSFAINMNHVSALKTQVGSRYFAVINDQLIPISRYKLADFKQSFTG